jgi:hypothetical protein
MTRAEKEERLHAFMLASRTLLLASCDQLTGSDLAAAQLLVEDVNDLAADFG